MGQWNSRLARSLRHRAAAVVQDNVGSFSCAYPIVANVNIHIAIICFISVSFWGLHLFYKYKSFITIKICFGNIKFTLEYKKLQINSKNNYLKHTYLIRVKKHENNKDAWNVKLF